jgi:hypothetical protein
MTRRSGLGVTARGQTTDTIPLMRRNRPSTIKTTANPFVGQVQRIPNDFALPGEQLMPPISARSPNRIGALPVGKIEAVATVATLAEGFAVAVASIDDGHSAHEFLAVLVRMSAGGDDPAPAGC